VRIERSVGAWVYKWGMKLIVYALDGSGKIVRLGKLGRIGRSYKLHEIDFQTGEIGKHPIGVGKARAGTNGVEDSFRWTFHCSGCGHYIAVNAEKARLKIQDYVPLGEECHLYDWEINRAFTPLPPSLPEFLKTNPVLKEYFEDNTCWAGINCEETKREPHGCTQNPCGSGIPL